MSSTETTMSNTAETKQNLFITARVWNTTSKVAECSKDCGSWQAAYAFLRDAQEPGDEIVKVKVADGVWFLEIRV